MFRIMKYVLRIRESVILNYGSGSGLPINYGSGFYFEIVVAIEKNLLSIR